MNTPFRNTPSTDFSNESERARFSAALSAVDARIRAHTLRCVPVIEGCEVPASEQRECLDPSDNSVIIGVASFCSAHDAIRAVTALVQGSSAWRRTAVATRAQALRKAAQEMLARRLELAAIIVREAGKPWKEADADVLEAIDFCLYYAQEAERLFATRLTMEVAGEDNFYLYEPLGVAAVISPWNFPLAITCGMTVAALVTGNTVALKPAEQAGFIAYELMQILFRAGIPTTALAFLPGVGEQVGRALVAHPQVGVIAFTGSKQVGLEILQACAQVPPTQALIKRSVLELGGKNAIIIDDDADSDEAIKGVIYSVFGYSGQKCSACSRLIVVGRNYEPFLQRLCEAAASIVSAKACEPATLVGPVIDAQSQSRIQGVIEEAKSIAQLAFSGTSPVGGYYVAPTIFRNVELSSSLWREEVFGPVLAANRADSFEAAIDMAMDSPYALTGGVYSRSPSHLEYAKREFRVGNLYLNRSCVGALVCRQPFGGSKLSGVGSKAGGPDYLLRFVDPRTISENTMRRGFTPQSS